ncbi:hypothetical protein GALL_507860 [mine drainage metagenome]|uniref:Uncharacterized protein n=1 Tax=mine drainage metagenome TaxID=410659 RepID=A0A1J5P7S2_9ZZZZ
MISWFAAINQAHSTTNPGFRNSDGWTEMNPSDNHRVAPLPKSDPMKGSIMINTKVTRNPTTPSRRTASGEISEVRNIATIASAPKIACRST